MCPSPVTSNRLKAVSMNLDQRVLKKFSFFIFLGPFWRGEEREEEAVVRVGEKPLFANSGQIDHKQEYPGNPSGHGKVCFSPVIDAFKLHTCWARCRGRHSCPSSSRQCWPPCRSRPRALQSPSGSFVWKSLSFNSPQKPWSSRVWLRSKSREESSSCLSCLDISSSSSSLGTCQPSAGSV